MRDLVARGNVHEDIVHFLARSGFNVIELPEGKDLNTALKWVSPHTTSTIKHLLLIPSRCLQPRTEGPPFRSNH